MKKLEWIEVMRGLAAIWVLLHHAQLAVNAFVGVAPSRLIANGHLGVDFFFVLSGFIIALSCERMILKGTGFSRYAEARLLRIYVPYLPIGITMLALYSMAPSLSEGGRSLSRLTSFTLLPANDPPALSVAWTLVHEMLFYTLFSIIFLSRRVLAVILLVWMLIILSVNFCNGELSRFSSYFLSPINLCFILGAVTYYATNNGVRHKIGWGALVLGTILIISQASSQEPQRIALAIGFAALIVAAASDIALNISPNRYLITLGAASYSIYLIHNPIESVAVRMAKFMNTTPWIAFGIVAATGLGAGIAYHFVYERKALQIVRSWLASSKLKADVIR